MKATWTANISERLSDDSDCWVIDSEDHSIAEMMCPKDVEQANAELIVKAVNSFDTLVGALQSIAAYKSGGVIPEGESVERDRHEMIHIARTALRLAGEQQ